MPVGRVGGVFPETVVESTHAVLAVTESNATVTPFWRFAPRTTNGTDFPATAEPGVMESMVGPASSEIVKMPGAVTDFPSGFDTVMLCFPRPRFAGNVNSVLLITAAPSTSAESAIN